MGYYVTFLIFLALTYAIITAYEVMPDSMRRKINAFIDDLGGVK
jgi:uncharacterized BrkB/YihY/UPF0761 family membrane protein